MSTIHNPTDVEQPIGFAIMPNWMVRSSLSVYAKIVFLVLSSRSGERGTWEMSHATIAQEASISVSAVQRSLRELDELGVISWVTNPNTKGEARRGNTYSIRVDRTGMATGVVKTPALTDRPPALTDRPPRSHRPTPSVCETDKEEPLEEPLEEPIQAPLPSVAPPKASSKRKAAAHPLPADWIPTTAHAKLAGENELELSTEVMRFRAHAEANDRRQVVWNAAFTQWLLNANRFVNRALTKSTVTVSANHRPIVDYGKPCDECWRTGGLHFKTCSQWDEGQ